MALVAAGLSYDEPQVRVDHALLGRQVSALDPLCELDLLCGRQERVDAGPAEKQRQGVRSGRRVLGREIGVLHVANAPAGLTCTRGCVYAGAPALADLLGMSRIVIAAGSLPTLATGVKAAQFVLL